MAKKETFKQSMERLDAVSYTHLIRGRIKTKESLREKIIRNRFYIEYDKASDILAHLSDLIGVSIECRFIHEEFVLLQLLRDTMSVQDEEGLYHHPDHPSRCV